MRIILRHILPGILLILVASALLLFSDRASRHREAPKSRTYTKEHPARIGILQPASNQVMDDLCKGLLDGLASRGYRNGDNLEAKVMNAEGDQPTMRLMAGQITSGTYDLGASISTLCLQSFAAADVKAHLPFVFCGVTSPVGAQVGIKSMDSLDKPAYMTGYGTAQPVEKIFREAVAANPKLKVVGVVWNPSEVNSAICTERARAICKELGITLLEAPIEGAKDVREAADSLVSRGAEAFWAGGDATLINAYAVLVETANKAHIPIFSNVSGHAKAGGLFDFGANYYEVGFETGKLAADVLDGRSPASVPVHDLMPGSLGLNEKVRPTLQGTWNFTPDQYNRAGYVVESNGNIREIKTAAGITASAAPMATTAPDVRSIINPVAGKLPWRIQLIEYMETAPSEEVIGGIKDGFKQLGFTEGKDYTLKIRCAQGDMPVINSLFDAAASEGADLYLVLSTPTLQTAVRKVQHDPVVFTFVADPVAAGAGKSDDDHLPNITGVSTLAPAKDMIALLKANFPNIKRVGTLFCPAEVNSMANLKYFTAAATAAGLEVESVAANAVGDLPDAATALASKNIDAVVQISDNLSAAGFSAISRACRTRHLPLFAFQSPMITQGAALAVSMDYHQAGIDATERVARVMRGDNPSTMPFTRPSKQLLVISLPNAKDVGLSIPPSLLDKADEVKK